LIIMSVLRKPGMMIRFDVVPRPVWTLILFNSVAHYNHLYFFPRIWFPSFSLWRHFLSNVHKQQVPQKTGRAMHF
jgi:hypothetical protein